MIIRIIPVRTWILLSLQGKEKICRNTPCSCLASLVPSGGMMLLAVVLGATNWWWWCSSKVCGQTGCGGTQQVLVRCLGYLVPPLEIPGFLGQREWLWMCCPAVGFLIHAGRGFSFPNILRLMKSPGCLDDIKQMEMCRGLSQELSWDVLGSSQGWWEEGPGCGTTPLWHSSHESDIPRYHPGPFYELPHV